MKKLKRSTSRLVGKVRPSYLKIPGLFDLVSGRTLSEVRVAYETYGKLNTSRTNAVLVCHSLTGDAHAAGFHSERDKKPGWWDTMIGPGAAFDTKKHFVICTNVLGGCKGTTGPDSKLPGSDRPYGMKFPVVTIRDMVRVQKALLDHLKIPELCAVAGGSMGGMQVLEWAALYPDFVRSAIVIASTSRLTPQSIAFDAVGRNAILSDPNWREGSYYRSSKSPDRGLSIARMIGHITYLSEESMLKKFGRRLQGRDQVGYDFSNEFQVESYLAHQGSAFVGRFDANSYLYMTRAMDYFDLADEFGSLEKAFKKNKGRFLIISFSSDWLFPPAQSREIVRSLVRTDRQVSYCCIDSHYGHDAFLLEFRQLTRLIKNHFTGLEVS